MPSMLLMDDDANHRLVIRHVLTKLYPDLEIVEYTQPVSDDPDHIADLQQYDLVLADTTVGGKVSLGWMMAVLKRHAQQEAAVKAANEQKTSAPEPQKIPDFIVLSSVKQPTPIVMQHMVVAIKNGVINFYFKNKLDMQKLIQDVAGVIGPPPEITSNKNDDELDETYQEKQQREAMEAAALALDSLQGHKQWPFTMDQILSGNATLGKFHIAAFLGEDNTASTFKATLPNIKVPIAVKIINRLRVGDKQIPESFVERFKVISENKHANVVRLLKYDVIEDRMVVALEFLHGGTLEDKLKNGKLDDKLAVHYFRQMMQGIAMLHGLGIELHQIVPRQLMFRDENTLVLTQIGLLNNLHALSEIAGEWPLPFSTPYYTTPESVHKQPTDQRSDIYLAGLMGYEMLTGGPAYDAGSDQDILYAHIMEPVPTLPDAGHRMNGLLTKMLDKEPSRRFQTADEVISELNKLYPPG